MSTATDVEVRAMQAEDRDAVIVLLSATQSWVPSELFDRFFSWKHLESPFGASPAWVATVGGRVVGFRTFVRWEFEHPDGRVRRAVRAVDTATHPEYQGRGIFRRLTMQSLDELRTDGVDFVFNTPNDKSRPGYLKMGWREVGRLPAAVRPKSAGAVVRMLRSRVPAERWSLVSTGGDAAVDVLSDSGTAALLASLAPAAALRTRRTVDYLRWRYSFEPLTYRALALDDDTERGVAVFRVRRRGTATEAALCEVLVPSADIAAAHTLERAVGNATDADYVIRLGGSSATSKFLRLPGQGPMLTWRDVSGSQTPPGIDDWQLQLGDVELF
ncbi:MAG: GNAT family N-acetyltransferase [Acidimicrobiia bacterium]